MCKLILSLLITTQVAFLGFGRQEPETTHTIPAEETQDNAEDTDQKMLSFNLVGFDEVGKKRWEIEGGSANFFGDLIKLEKVITKSYGEKDSVILTADKGTYDKLEGKVHLEENVVAISESGAKLTTDSLDWDANAKTVTTDDRVRLEKDNLESIGKGVVAQPDLKTVQLNKDVTVNVHPKKASQQPTVITCKGPLAVDYQNNIATFNQDVKVEDKDGEIYSDKMDIYFSTADESVSGTENKSDEESQQFKIIKIVCIGNVKIVRGENTSFSQEAVYTAEDKKIILIGEPRLVIYSSEEGGPGLFGEEEE